MTRVARLAIIGLLSAAWINSSDALAQTASKSPTDPNAKVCETVSQLGSRLSKKKVCATRAEWAEMKRQDREVIDQVQRAAQIGCSISPALTNGPVPTC